MNIINESSLDYLDKMTNTRFEESNVFEDGYVYPVIRDIGDVGVTTGINF